MRQERQPSGWWKLDGVSDVRCVTFSALGPCTASGGNDYTIILWNPQTHQQLNGHARLSSASCGG